MTDIRLIPLPELVNEIERRTECFIMAYTMRDPQERNDDWFYYGKGKRGKSVQLASDLHNEVTNNWNNELKTLQRINTDGIF